MLPSPPGDDRPSARLAPGDVTPCLAPRDPHFADGAPRPDRRSPAPEPNPPKPPGLPLNRSGLGLGPLDPPFAPPRPKTPAIPSPLPWADSIAHKLTPSWPNSPAGPPFCRDIPPESAHSALGNDRSPLMPPFDPPVGYIAPPTADITPPDPGATDTAPPPKESSPIAPALPNSPEPSPARSPPDHSDLNAGTPPPNSSNSPQCPGNPATPAATPTPAGTTPTPWHTGPTGSPYPPCG